MQHQKLGEAYLNNIASWRQLVRCLQCRLACCVCRAKAAAEAVGGPQDDHGVPAGSHVVVHIARVPSAAAAALVARVSAHLQVRAAAPPLDTVGGRGMHVLPRMLCCLGRTTHVAQSAQLLLRRFLFNFPNLVHLRNKQFCSIP